MKDELSATNGALYPITWDQVDDGLYLLGCKNSELPRWLNGMQSACPAEDMGWIPGLEDPLEKKMAV